MRPRRLGEFDSLAIVIDDVERFERKKLRKNNDSQTILGRPAIWLKNISKKINSCKKLWV